MSVDGLLKPFGRDFSPNVNPWSRQRFKHSASVQNAPKIRLHRERRRERRRESHRDCEEYLRIFQSLCVTNKFINEQNYFLCLNVLSYLSLAFCALQMEHLIPFNGIYFSNWFSVLIYMLAQSQRLRLSHQTLNAGGCQSITELTQTHIHICTSGSERSLFSRSLWTSMYLQCVMTLHYNKLQEKSAHVDRVVPAEPRKY